MEEAICFNIHVVIWSVVFTSVLTCCCFFPPVFVFGLSCRQEARKAAPSVVHWRKHLSVGRVRGRYEEGLSTGIGEVLANRLRKGKQCCDHNGRCDVSSAAHAGCNQVQWDILVFWAHCIWRTVYWGMLNHFLEWILECRSSEVEENIWPWLWILLSGVRSTLRNSWTRPTHPLWRRQSEKSLQSLLFDPAF